jgi:hypothetical protein
MEIKVKVIRNNNFILYLHMSVRQEEYDYECCTSCLSPEGNAPGKELSSCASSHAVCERHDERVQD